MENMTNETQSVATMYAPVPMGTVVAFLLTKNYIPAGWLLCDGSPIPAQYQQLIASLSSFHTPNLGGRTLIGTGVPNNGKQSDGSLPNFDLSNNWPIGYTGGEYQHALVISEMPSHNHTLQNASDSGNTLDNSSNWQRANIQGGVDNTSYAGGNQPHNNMQPYSAVNYIIYAGQ